MQVKAVAEEMGIGFLGIGFQPKWRREEIPVMPKVTSISKLYTLVPNFIEAVIFSTTVEL